MGATGTSSTERPVTHDLSSTLQDFVGSVGKEILRPAGWLTQGLHATSFLRSGHKHYTVSFEYPGPSPSLKGAGDNDLPVKGVVDLEFKVGRRRLP